MNIRRQSCFFVFFIGILGLLFIASCGKKGDPTLKSFEKPMPAKDVRAARRENEIIISWSYPSVERQKIKGFYVEKAEGESREYKNITFLKEDASQFIDKDFKTGRTYFYRISVYSLRDVISDASPVIKASPSSLPQPPENFSYKLLTDAVEIKWNGIKDAKYNVYKTFEKGKYPASSVNGEPLKEPVFKDKVITEKPVYYSVRSLLDGEMREEGFQSKEFEINPKSFVPSRPSGLKFVPSEKKVYLMWTENPETWINGYRVYRKRASENAFKMIGEATTPAFADNESLSSKTFYYVSAMGPQQESGLSETIEVEPLIER
jgi:fibronectin type 3 domain-containing protein